LPELGERNEGVLFGRNEPDSFLPLQWGFFLSGRDLKSGINTSTDQLFRGKSLEHTGRGVPCLHLTEGFSMLQLVSPQKILIAVI
jgi:hypothetical protein